MTDLDLTPAELATYEAELASPLAISTDAQELLFRQARTANAWGAAPVTDQQLQAVYELIKWGPTAMNSQPLRVMLVRSPEARERLAEHMSGNNKDKTRTAPLVAVLAADIDFHEELHKIFPVFPGARNAFAEEEMRAQAAILNATLQAGYFIVGVRAAGLAAGPMTGFDPDGVSREFFPDGRHRALVVVNLGQATEESFRPRQPRLDYDEVVSSA